MCEGVASRVEVTQEILNFFNLQKLIKIKKVNSEYFSKEYFATRPISERLINSKLNSLSLNIMRNWKVCLREYLTKEYSQLIK